MVAKEEAEEKQVKEEGNQEEPQTEGKLTKDEPKAGKKTKAAKEEGDQKKPAVRKKETTEKEISKKDEPAGEIKAVTAKSEDLADTLKFVYMTEKAIRNIEKENMLVFIVDRAAGKDEIRAAVETEYKENVASVNTLIDQKGRKKAVIKFVKPSAAGDVAIKLGII